MNGAIINMIITLFNFLKMDVIAITAKSYDIAAVLKIAIAQMTKNIDSKRWKICPGISTLLASSTVGKSKLDVLEWLKTAIVDRKNTR